MKLTSINDIPPHLRRLNAGLFPKQSEGARIADNRSEADLHSEIITYCRERGWVYLHGSMAAATHRTLGEPDFVILASEGRVLLVECKSATGKLSIEQQGLAMQAAKLGHTVHVVRSMEEFEKLV